METHQYDWPNYPERSINSSYGSYETVVMSKKRKHNPRNYHHHKNSGVTEPNQRKTTRSDVLEALSIQRKNTHSELVDNSTSKDKGIPRQTPGTPVAVEKHIPGYYFDPNQQKYFRIGREVHINCRSYHVCTN